MQFANAKAICEDTNLTSRIQKLCDGLDNESKTTIARIICALSQAYRNNQPIIETLTYAESSTLSRIHNEFYPNIFKLSENIYCYKGLLFPTYFFEISVLWHKHCLKQAFSAKTLESIKSKDIIDVGGCIGDSAIVFQEFSDKHIHSFEPTQANYKLMLQTISLNNASRIIPVNKGLGSKKETLKMNINLGGSSAVFASTDVFEEVEIITLDSYVKEHNLEVGFIKVDIEGFEQQFLQGAKETISTQKPAMLISIYHTIDDFFNIKPMIESWNLGYSFKVIKPIDFSLSTETALFCEITH